MRTMERVRDILKSKKAIIMEDMRDLRDEYPDTDEGRKRKEADPKWRSPGDLKTLGKAITKVEQAIKSAKTKEGKVYRTRWGKIVRVREGKSVDDEDEVSLT